MAENTQTYTTRIFLNTEEAKKQLQMLQEQVEILRKKKDQAAKDGDWPTFNNAKKQLDMVNNQMRALQTSSQTIDRVLGNLSTSSIKEIQQTIRAINKELESGAIERGSEEWEFLNKQLSRCKTELKEIRGESAATESAWSKLTGFLNENWGAMTQMMDGIANVSMTVRQAVQDFADMEEEMADVRKYTGLTGEQVRDLNEDLKKMDTRTSREELNQLAGSAGRLGLQAKKDILEFVEAADMIGVALGDDLGQGAVDKIGKLAMAFGEDEKKGLKQAMLSTGSALNELAQNSSAQAGYLVEFTARVAGFGKQLGLTQAQIMGFGTVMDENLLKDEMAATAFGNMLTKMQTDTAKFARIAGMDLKKFTDLLNKDANAAILALADNLKKADPQEMMKMLNDMGLDGSRAVGVLSTLADKIDDVRTHQQRATKAYDEAKSVQNEFNTMNNTVQARLDKCRKAFKEMAVELGERLLPVVRYTINGAALLAKTLSVLTGFFVNNWKAIAVVSAELGVLTVVYRAAEIRAYAWYVKELLLDKLHKAQIILMKARTAAVLTYNAAVALLTGNLTRAAAAMRLMRATALSNPYTAILAVILAVGTAVWGVVAAWRSHNKAVRDNLQSVKELKAANEAFNDVKKKAAQANIEEKTRIEQLTKVIRSNAYSVDQRRAAIQKLQSIVPEYQAKLTREGELHETNTKAIDDYIKKLDEMALAQAIFDKKKELYQKKTDNYIKQQRIQNSLNAVQAERDAHPDRYKSDKHTYMSGATEERNEALIDSQRQEKRHNERMEEAKSEEKIIAAEERILDKMMNSNKNIRAAVTSMITADTGTGTNTTVTPPTTPYKSETEQKKEEEERKRLERERKEQLREAEEAAKAESDAAIAAKTHEYAMGKIAYREYIQEIARLQTEGLKKRRDVYEKGSAEYEKLNRQVEERNLKGDEKINQLKLEDMQRDMLRQQAVIEGQAEREEITEQEKQERLRMLQESYLADKVELYQKGTKERMDAEWELEQTEQRNKQERERQYQRQLEQIREQYLGMSDKRQMEITLQGLERLHDAGIIKEKEYQAAKAAIQAQYAGYQTTTERNQKVGSDMLKVAGDAARKELDGKSGSTAPFVGDIMQYQTTMEKLKELYGNDKENHAAYLAAKQQATAMFCQQMASQFQAAYQGVSQIMSSLSSLYSAQADYETAMVRKKYEKQIEAAGNNQKRVKKLQEKQAKEEAAIKSKYNKKQVKIQIAQAIAQTAQNALLAYGSVLVPGVPWTYALAAVASAMALASGAIQIAAIKKQALAQEAGYYEGGFTGGRQYRKEAGVVHEGEFVANHQAVQNPAILPFLNFLDQAQRNNTVGSLSMQDVSRQLSGGASGSVVAPIVNVQMDNNELRDTMDRMQGATEELNDILAEGIDIRFDMDRFDRNYRHYQKLKQRP